MPRKRLIIFLSTLLALFVLPLSTPYAVWHIILPWWAYVFYSIIVLSNAGVYLLQRYLLIDRYLVHGRIMTYVLLSLALLILSFIPQYLANFISGHFDIGDGTMVFERLGFNATIVQPIMMFMLLLITTFIALAVSMSDEWRMATFRYHAAENKKRSLESDMNKLQSQLDTIKLSSPQKTSITVNIDLMKRQLQLKEILYIKSDGDYSIIHLSNGQAPMVLMSLKKLEKQLPFDQFCRTHRSYLVNMEKVDGVKEGKVLIANEVLPLSDSRKAAFFELLSHKSIILNYSSSDTAHPED